MQFLDGLSVNARKAVEERYTLDTMVDKLSALYMRLAG